ncbi:transposase [Streptomyces populi]|uniref:transposase n=1 Tax=Streptomyces populi TaxID=2058924 RepID=UPI0035DB4F32
MHCRSVESLTGLWGIGGDPTDPQWERLEPLLPASNRRCGRWRDHRQVINGVPYRIRTGAQWRELPERHGRWKTVHERYRRRSADGTWELLLQRVQAEADATGDVEDSGTPACGLCPVCHSVGGAATKDGQSCHGHLVVTGRQRSRTCRSRGTRLDLAVQQPGTATSATVPAR